MPRWHVRFEPDFVQQRDDLRPKAPQLNDAIKGAVVVLGLYPHLYFEAPGTSFRGMPLHAGGDVHLLVLYEIEGNSVILHGLRELPRPSEDWVQR